MSLIGVSAALIRLAAVDDAYAQELFEALDADEDTRARLVNARISEDELAQLTPAEWQWYANWRQRLDGPLDRRLLDYLTDSVTTRFARFEVRALVLRDRRTNELAPEYDRPPDRDETDDTIGLNWLSEQAQGQRVAFRTADIYWRAERGEPFDDEFFAELRRAANAEWLELTTDALQCATNASWFLLRLLMSPESQPVFPYVDELRGLVAERLRAFAAERDLNPEWYQRGQQLRSE